MATSHSCSFLGVNLSAQQDGVEAFFSLEQQLFVLGLEQQLCLVAAPEALEVAVEAVLSCRERSLRTSRCFWAEAILRTKNLGGVTPCLAAQSSLSWSELQQQRSQQCWAEEHPQELFSQGNRSLDAAEELTGR